MGTQAKRAGGVEYKEVHEMVHERVFARFSQWPGATPACAHYTCHAYACMHGLAHQAQSEGSSIRRRVCQ